MSVRSETDSVERAAEWLRQNRASCERPLLPTMRRQFGISSADAIHAIRLANRLDREEAVDADHS